MKNQANTAILSLRGLIIATLFGGMSIISSCSKDESINPASAQKESSNSTNMAMRGEIPVIIIKHGEDRYGKAPVYRIQVFDGGYALYTGIDNVAVREEVKLEIDPQLVEELLRYASYLRIQDMREEYPGATKGLAGTGFSIEFTDDFTKTITEFGLDVPQELDEFEAKVEGVLNIRDLTGI